MKKYITNIDVRYAETDQMGVVHHSPYAVYFELGRIQWLDEMGFSYDQMERTALCYLSLVGKLTLKDQLF